MALSNYHNKGETMYSDKNFTPSKPFLSYQNQMIRLRDHYKLNILDEEICLRLLKSISYYDLVNGYKDCFMVDNIYKSDTNIIEIFLFMTFDKNFQNLLFKYSIYIEATFKTRLSYVIAKNLGENEVEYLKWDKYTTPKRKKIEKNKTFQDIKNVLNHPRPENPLKHYKENHNHVPPWILFKSVTFNTTTHLYSFLKPLQKREILSEYFNDIDIKYEEKAELFRNMIIIVRKFRNKIAHNYKVINEKVTGASLNKTNSSSLLRYNLYNVEDMKNLFFGRSDMFAMLVSTLNLLEEFMLADVFIKELLRLLYEAQENHVLDLYLKQNNLPSNLIERLEKYNFARID